MIRPYALLNVVAHPHPKGVYRRLFEAAATSQPVRFQTDKFARISPITETEGGIFRGRLATWTEIDPKSPSVNKKSLEEKTLADAGIRLPSDIGFNSKIFFFAFREEGHALYVEKVNDEGRSLAPSTARSAFQSILKSAMRGITEDVVVHVASRSDAISYVLSVPHIRKIEIDLYVPNPDELSEAHRAALAELEAMNLKRLRTTATKAPGQDTIVLSERYKILAALAKDNGSVEVTGKDEGKRIFRSTKDRAAEIEEEIAGDDSSYGVIGRIAREGREITFLNDSEDDDGEILE